MRPSPPGADARLMQLSIHKAGRKTILLNYRIIRLFIPPNISNRD